MPGLRFVKFWLPVVLWMLVIFGASTKMGSPQYTSRFIGPIVRFFVPDISDHALAKVHYCVRKTSHFIEYAILALLLARALCVESSSTSHKKEILLAILLCAFYAASDELHQEFVKGREASVTDVLLDTGGATFGVIIYRAFNRRRKPD